MESAAIEQLGGSDAPSEGLKQAARAASEEALSSVHWPSLKTPAGQRAAQGKLKMVVHGQAASAMQPGRAQDMVMLQAQEDPQQRMPAMRQAAAAAPQSNGQV